MKKKCHVIKTTLNQLQQSRKCYIPYLMHKDLSMYRHITKLHEQRSQHFRSYIYKCSYGRGTIKEPFITPICVRVIWDHMILLENGSKPLYCTNLSNHTHFSLQRMCGLIWIIPHYWMETCIWILPLYKHSACVPVNNCWITVTCQNPPLTPPSQELTWQQGLCYGMWEGLREQNYSNDRDILGIDFNSSLVQTDLSRAGVTTHCDQHLRDTANIRHVQVMCPCWLPQKHQSYKRNSNTTNNEQSIVYMNQTPRVSSALNRSLTVN